MSIPYLSTNEFDTARPNIDSWIEFPFINKGDSTTKVYHLRCTMLRSDYDPSDVALDTTMASATNAAVTSLPFAADVNAYFVGDYDHQISDGVLITFDRQFANIPIPTVDPAGSEIFTFPGLPATSGTGSRLTISTASVTNNVLTVITSSSHGMSSGDNFRFYLRGTTAIFGRNYGGYIYGNGTAISGTSGSTIKFNAYLPESFTFTSGNIDPFASRGRKQVSRKSSTQLEYQYYLPGVSPGITTTQDINLPQRFEAFRYSEGNTVSTLNSYTNPSAIEYNAIVDGDGFLVLDSGISRWKGNITRQTVKSIRAI
jgi:hypothetical protein